MPSNRDLIVTAAAAAVVVGAIVKDYRKVVRIERQKRVEIQENLSKDLAAIRLAAAKTEQEIRSGRYDNRSIAEVLEGYEFNRITSRFED